MDKDVFGSIMYSGKMVNLDKENIESLEKMSQELKEKCNTLKKKANSIFNQ